MDILEDRSYRSGYIDYAIDTCRESKIPSREWLQKGGFLLGLTWLFLMKRHCDHIINSYEYPEMSTSHICVWCCGCLHSPCVILLHIWLGFPCKFSSRRKMHWHAWNNCEYAGHLLCSIPAIQAANVSDKVAWNRDKSWHLMGNVAAVLCEIER